MKKLIVLSVICAAVIISCGKKMMPESGANDPSKPVNNKSASSGTPVANTNPNASVNAPENGLPSFRDSQKSGAATAQAQNINSDAYKGKAVYVTKCGTCHALKTPIDYTADQMKNILAVEIPKAKLDSKEAKQVTAYLMDNVRK
jgi:mono/diheme cytochrome c family protein